MDRLGLPDRGYCRTCGERVTDMFRRGFGDRDDVVHRCTNCDTKGRIYRGSAAGRDLDAPDPLDNPGRARDVPEIPDSARSGGGVR